MASDTRGIRPPLYLMLSIVYLRLRVFYDIIYFNSREDIVKCLQKYFFHLSNTTNTMLM